MGLQPSIKSQKFDYGSTAKKKPSNQREATKESPILKLYICNRNRTSGYIFKSSYRSRWHKSKHTDKKCYI